MLGSQWRRRTLVALFPFVAACGTSLRSQAPAVTPGAAPVQATAPASDPAPLVAPIPEDDPVLTLISSSDRHFEAGQKELEQGVSPREACLADLDAYLADATALGAKFAQA